MTENNILSRIDVQLEYLSQEIGELKKIMLWKYGSISGCAKQ